MPRLWLCFILVCSLLPGFAGDRLDFYGDLRFRAESDWDSRRSDGTEREDRDRLRFRARLGLKWAISDAWDFNVRARSGSEASQQSPHITFHDFDGNGTGDHDVVFDRWVFTWKGDRGKVHLGRTGLNDWHQDELFWDDDVAPAGVGGEWKINDRSRLNGGIYLLPDGARDFHGEMLTAQWVFEPTKAWTLGVGPRILRGDEGSRYLRNGNGARDYDLLVFTGQYRVPEVEAGLKLGLDLVHNFADYEVDDAFGYANRDETDGFIVSAVWGSTKPGRWLGGVYFGEVQTLAVNASYAQDDWVRWGSATQTDSSDLRGYELRLAYGVRQDLNVVLRYFDVESPTSPQDGKRARLDVNYKF